MVLILTEYNGQSEQITQLFCDDSFISLRFTFYINCGRQNSKDDSPWFLFGGYPNTNLGTFTNVIKVPNPLILKYGDYMDRPDPTKWAL